MAQDTDQAVGLVESIEGLATVLHTGDAEVEIELTLGSPLYLNDQITTGESAAVSVRFVDRTSFSIGEDSRLTIDEYIYDPTTAEGKVDISVLKGMFVFISGLVADENPQNMTISTPGATIGIRGTEGGGEIGEAGESSYYFNADGIIEIITPSGSVTVDETMEVAVVSPTGTPTLATGWSAEQIIETFVSALRVAPLEISQRIINADGNLNVDAREYIERLVQQASDRDSGDGASDDQDDQPESDDQGAGDADADAQEASGEGESEGEESQTTLADNTTVEADSSAVALDISFGEDESQGQEDDHLAQQDNASELVNSSPGSVAGASEDTSDADDSVSAEPELERQIFEQQPEAAPPVTDEDVDEDAPVFSSGSTASLAENAAVNAVVYNAQASDNNGAAGITYSLSGAAAFSIDAASGAVSLNTGLDFEAQSSYALVVTATDATGNQATQAVTVTVTDVDEDAPVFSSGSTASLAENAAVNAVVYNAQASDAGGGITYSLSGAAAFSIDAASGAVSLNTGLDFEAQSSYALVVTATDATGNQATQAVTVTITDVDEDAPVFSSGSTASLAENAAVNAVVYNAQASDNNGAAGITYSLSGAAAFSIDAASGAVSLNTGLDFEAQSSYALVVTATDATGNQATQAVTVTITE